MEEKQSLVGNDIQRRLQVSTSQRRILIIAGISLLIFGLIAIAVWQVSLTSSGNNDENNTDPFEEMKGFCANVQPIQSAEFKQRILNLQNALISNNLYGYVTEPGANMKYFTGVTWKLSERPFLMVISQTNTTVNWICPAFEERRCREVIGENATIFLWQEDQSAYELVWQVLQLPSGHTNATIAVDSEIRYFIVDGILSTWAPMGLSVVNGNNYITSLRAIKSKAEIDIMRCVNMATKRAIKLVAQQVQSGMTEQDISFLIVKAQNMASLTNVWNLVLFGPDASFPHGTNAIRYLQDGELILIDTGGELYGYQSDITRTFAFGQVSDDKRKAWNTVKQAQTAALNTISTSVTCSDLDNAARTVIVNAGYGPDFAYFTHRLGHGIGLQGHEMPYLVRGNNQTLLVGFTFSDEPGIYIPNEFGIRLEDIVTVTENGYEVFGALSPSLDDPFEGH